MLRQIHLSFSLFFLTVFSGPIVAESGVANAPCSIPLFSSQQNVEIHHIGFTSVFILDRSDAEPPQQVQVTGSANTAEEAILRAIEAVRKAIGGAYNPSKLTIQAIATSAECWSISFKHN